MPTALTVYMTNVRATTLTNAIALVANSTGGGEYGFTTLIGTGTGYGEFIWNFTSNAWPAGSSLGAPSGLGGLYDTIAFEGLTIVAGTWTPSVRGSISGGTGNLTADLYVRAYKYNSTSQTYTLIGTCELAAQTITGTTTTFPFSGTSLAAATFGTGDKLYLDFWLDVTANANTSSTAKLNFDAANSSILGNASNELVTPGYVVAGTANIAANAAMSEAAQIIASGQTLQSNAVIAAPAQVVDTVSVQSNSAAPLAGAQVSAPAATQSNSAAPLAGAQVSAPASIQSNSALSESAQIVILAQVLQAISILSASGILLDAPGMVSIGDTAFMIVTLNEMVLMIATLSDVVLQIVTIKDQI